MSMDRRNFLAFMGGTAAVLSAGIDPAAAASPFVIEKKFVIPRGVQGSTAQLSLAARPDGGYATIYEQTTQETATPSFARFYSAAHSTVGSVVPLAKTTYAGDYIGTIVVNDDGSANAFFYGWPPGELDLWWMQRISAAGKPIGKPIRLDTGLSGDFHLAAKLTNGNIMAAWRSYGGSTAKVVTPSGTIVGTNLNALTNGALEAIAPLTNGGAVAAYYGPDLKASFQRLTPTAKRTGNPISEPAVYSAGGMTVAAHPKGFVGVWKNVDAADAPIMQGAVYSSTGTKLFKLATVKLQAADRYRNFYSVAYSLANGRVLVVYDSVRRPDPSGYKRYYEIIAVLYSSTGAVLGKQTLYSQGAEAELWDYLTRPRALIQLKSGSFLLGYDGGYDGSNSIKEARGIQFRLA